MPKFSADLTMMFNEVDFLDRFRAAADAGFKGVEFQSAEGHSTEVIQQRLEEAGVKLVKLSFSSETSDAAKDGVAILPGREPEFRKCLQSAIEATFTLGCPSIFNLAGVRPPGVTRDACLKTYVENLRWATGALAEFGLRLLIEPINQHGVPGYFLSRTEEALEVIDRVEADNLLLLYDIYHAQIAEGNLAQTLREHIDRIGHIHIAGVPGRHEPDFGEIKYPYLFELLDELGYDGWVGAEYRPRAGTVQGLGWARGYGIG